MISGINCTDPDWLFYSGIVAITDGVEPVSCGLNTRPPNIGSISNLSALIMISGINCTDPDWLFYSGIVAITDGGRICQMWTEHTPHQTLIPTVISVL